MSVGIQATVQNISQGNSECVEVLSSDCTVSFKRIQGPIATELFLSCKPSKAGTTASEQTRNLYTALQNVLESEGANLDALVSETIFLRDIAADIQAFRDARNAAFKSSNSHSIESAITEIQQPPLDKSACLEIAAQAIIPNESALNRQVLRVGEEDEVTTGIMVELDTQSRVLAGGLCGDGDNAYDQTTAMFEKAEKILHAAGMEFTDVVRTWIYLREMERDYPSLNASRREFFKTRGVDPVPASTGIEGGMVDAKHDLCLGFYAVKSEEDISSTVMTTPTLNEAGEYGADFVRGMKMVETNKVALHISGTASIDEAGRTAHVDDIAAQIDRMILNIKTLLENQGAGFGDIVSAYNYLKDPKDEQLLRDKFKAAGFEGFPNNFVHAAVCRPDLLCETEVLASLPLK